LGDFFERKLRPKTEKCAQTAKCTTYLGKIFGDFFIKTWPKTEKCAQTAKCTTYLGKILGDFFIKNAAKRQKQGRAQRCACIQNKNISMSTISGRKKTTRVRIFTPLFHLILILVNPASAKFTNKILACHTYIFQGVDVMITILCDFRRKKWRFFSKTNVMIKFLQEFEKKSKCFGNFLREYLKNHKSGPKMNTLIP
jgi:hypothetical protein